MASNDTRAGVRSASGRLGLLQPPAGLTALDWIALALVIVGGLNWGLVGLFSFDLVAALFGTMSMAARIVYVLVGLSALYCTLLAARIQTKLAAA